MTIDVTELPPLSLGPGSVACAAGGAGAVVVVGAGGNIGSHLVPLIGRIPGIRRAVLIDRDIYEARNLSAQAILPRDVGLRKADAMARLLRRIRPSLVVEAFAAPLESLPLGFFRADIVIACLDSREARRAVNQIAWRLGMPWLDAGVDGSGLLARVSAYDPREAHAPCQECRWGEADYRALEQTYPCLAAAPDLHPASQVPPTNASAALGSLAAALAAIECEKWLAGRADRLAAGCEVLIDASAHAHHRSVTRRKPGCRFDHDTWRVERLEVGPEGITLEAALGLPAQRGEVAAGAATCLEVDGQRFLSGSSCAVCGRVRLGTRLAASLRPIDVRCRGCGREMIAAGFDLTERLDPQLLGEPALRRTLRGFGLRPGEVVSVRHQGGAAHYELARRSGTPDAAAGRRGGRGGMDGLDG